MDANRDGQITRDEWKGRPKAFGKLDKNNDGTISRQEAMDARQGRGKQHLKRIDTDNDGQISRNEWNGNPDAFSKLDANNDGVITKEEMKAGRHKAQRPPQ
jgi:Ca2+-binding EF-hand superfamily protein